ncbi:MAG TPA: succinyl-diaminopimelate desuccinylase [Acidimicrobiales bacterium]|nr:succinyl-diaminopimelate desuccinylase [Acidimicrobiales bacterium]
MSRLDDVYELVSISSVSHHESALADHVEAALRTSGFLEVDRIGDNVVARTVGEHATRVIVAGHLDTVPGDASLARREGDVLTGLGACDMKGSLAVMLALAREETPRASEVTWIFYAREEISRDESGLSELRQRRPELLDGDVAVLCEPTAGVVEAGCQGTLRVRVDIVGERAHTARPFTGRNAIHRAGDVITRVAHYEPRRVELDGVEYCDQLQVVFVEGGVAPNVVPDAATVTINHRVAPDRSRDEAVVWLRDYLGDLLEDADTLSVIDWAPSAPPSLTNERLSALVELTGGPVRGKLGWTDVATFYELSIPATNFGAGDPLLAHRSDEMITGREVEDFERVLREWLG